MTTTNTTTETTALHIADFRGVRHASLELGALDPVVYLRDMATAHFRAHARKDYRASITRGGRVIARVYFADNGRTLRMVAEAR